MKDIKIKLRKKKPNYFKLNAKVEKCNVLGHKPAMEWVVNNSKIEGECKRCGRFYQRPLTQEESKYQNKSMLERFFPYF